MYDPSVNWYSDEGLRMGNQISRQRNFYQILHCIIFVFLTLRVLVGIQNVAATPPTRQVAPAVIPPAEPPANCLPGYRADMPCIPFADIYKIMDEQPDVARDNSARVETEDGPVGHIDADGNRVSHPVVPVPVNPAAESDTGKI